MQIIPLAAVASQTLQVQPADQMLSLAVYQKTTGVFVDISLGQQVILRGVIGLDRVRMVRSLYLGITGDLMFVDQSGYTDPNYEGFGTRFLLYWLSSDDVAGLPGT